MKKKTRLRLYLLSGVLFALVLILDDLVFHWFGDLSWVDGYNPYTHHWMIGAGILMVVFYIMKKRRKEVM